MKITKSLLQQIIKEELEAVLEADWKAAKETEEEKKAAWEMHMKAKAECKRKGGTWTKPRPESDWQCIPKLEAINEFFGGPEWKKDRETQMHIVAREVENLQDTLEFAHGTDYTHEEVKRELLEISRKIVSILEKGIGLDDQIGGVQTLMHHDRDKYL